MQNIVLLPGIFGTRMVRSDGFELWPPIGQDIPLDVETRASQLIDPTTRPGGILESVRAFPTIDIPEYSPITDFLSNLPSSTLQRFPYDWRLDLRQTAAILAAYLATLDGAIILVAHSMGGLICRFLLESGHFDQEPWFARIKQLVCIAVPHLGAPLSVFRLLGTEGMSGFLFPGRAMGILASRPDIFPAGHQLLPPPNIGCVQTPTAQNSNVGNAFPIIDPKGLAAGTALHAVLDQFRRPNGIEYLFAFGHGYMDSGHLGTTVGITLGDRSRINHVFGEGDGTVPFWSALPVGPAGFFTDQFGIVGDHVGILADPLLLQRLEAWLSPRIS